VPYFKNLQKYADFWIAGTVKYPKLVETAVDSLADLVNNYIIILNNLGDLILNFVGEEHKT